MVLIKGDRNIIVAIVLLLLVSALAVYSSTTVLAYQKAGGNTFFYLFRHTVFLLLGLFVMTMTSRMKTNYILGTSPIMVIMSVVLLLLTMVIGSSINGASRWLSIGGITFQPSELAKVSLLIYVARELAHATQDSPTRGKGNPDRAFWKVMGVTAVICGIIMFENLSTCLLIAGSVFILMFVARVSLVRLGGIALVAVLLVVSVILFAPVVSKYFPRAETWRARVERYMGDSEAGAEGANYQADMAKAAVSSGGALGKGIGNSYVKNFLPMAYSDFIFSIILEEGGMPLCLLVVGCYFTIFVRCRRLAVEAIMHGDSYHVLSRAYLIMGLGTMIVLQAFINMMVGVGLIPVTGQTLPLVSMGGTSNLIAGLAVGAILSATQEIGEMRQTA